MTIRVAALPDAPALARLRHEFRSALDPVREDEAGFLVRCESWMAERLQGPGWRCWVEDLEGEIVGMVWLHLVEKVPNPVGEAERHGYISSLYVRPGRRGRGLGSALLGACLAACSPGEVDAVILWPTPDSRRLYMRHGFAVRDDLMERRGSAGVA